MLLLQILVYLRQVFVVIEDWCFYKHYGVDMCGLLCLVVSTSGGNM